AYGYMNEKPSILDFVIELFKSCYAMATGGQVLLNGESLVFLKRWKDSLRHKDSFEKLSNRCAKHLNIEEDLNRREFRDLLEVDYFELIDLKILSDLAGEVRGSTITAGECAQHVRERRVGHWFSSFVNAYEALAKAAQFNETLTRAKIEVESFDQGIRVYKESLYLVDQLYRQFHYCCRRSGCVTLLGELAQEVDNRYVNRFLRPLGDAWQGHVDQLEQWKPAAGSRHSEFFNRHVGAFREKGNKVCIVVSDALRYEAGAELATMIRQEDRYEAKIGHLVTTLPSYTQLGMAALLPHDTLAIRTDGSVAVDGRSSQGLASRQAILDARMPGKATALKADELLSMGREDSRALTRDHEVVYIYHNRIDKTGHSLDTEKDVFLAAGEAIDELLTIIKKLFNANASSVLVTADHGFLYQQTVDESDYSVAEPGGEVLYSDRRFIIGRGLTEVDGVKKFASEQLGLAGDLEVVVPKSINRFRKKGSAARFAHGGCTLQEVVVPLIDVTKRRTSDQTVVEVDLIPTSSIVISTGQLAVALHQTSPVTEKVRPRVLRIGLYADDGTPISDEHDLVFDLASENPREREIKVKLVLAKEADAYNGKPVSLQLKTSIQGTSHYEPYKSTPYTLRRSFTSDFDF
ncbi:MAG: BREX-1 system phosphatase PglZ type A, partial [Planctomycetales bacterium]|nr:BREX-1 system phosphatase PglZ type A [Planctomycetales bacterium]